jgi:hypothetical protein
MRGNKQMITINSWGIYRLCSRSTNRNCLDIYRPQTTVLEYSQRDIKYLNTPNEKRFWWEIHRFHPQGPGPPDPPVSKRSLVMFQPAGPVGPGGPPGPDGPGPPPRDPIACLQRAPPRSSLKRRPGITPNPLFERAGTDLEAADAVTSQEEDCFGETVFGVRPSDVRSLASSFSVPRAWPGRERRGSRQAGRPGRQSPLRQGGRRLPLLPRERRLREGAPSAGRDRHRHRQTYNRCRRTGHADPRLPHRRHHTGCPLPLLGPEPARGRSSAPLTCVARNTIWCVLPEW